MLVLEIHPEMKSRELAGHCAMMEIPISHGMTATNRKALLSSRGVTNLSEMVFALKWPLCLKLRQP